MAELVKVPPGGELWKIGNENWVVYNVPGSQPPVPMGWRVTDLAAVQPAGGSVPTARTLGSRSDAYALGMLNMGIDTELVEFSQDPFATFVQDYNEQAQANPMLQDEEVMALYAGAILEGRTPTPEELTQTDFWQSKGDAEREWLTLLTQDPETARDKKADHRRAVETMLREAGVADAPEGVVNLLADRWVGGAWSESFITNQVRGLADPYSGIELTGEIINAARDYDPTTGDASALAGGEAAVRKRLEDMFTNRGLDPNVHDDGTVEEGRLDRLVQQVLAGNGTGQTGSVPGDADYTSDEQVLERVAEMRANRGLTADPESDDIWLRRIKAGTHDLGDARAAIEGKAASEGRSLADVRKSLDQQAGTHPLTGRDVTRGGEAEVQQLLQDWLGPALAAQYEGEWTRKWAGRMRNDPDAQIELVDELKRLRQAAFPEWDNENIRYSDIAPLAQTLFRNVWEEDPGETDPLFIDVLRMVGPGGDGMNAAAARLRKEGLTRGVQGVTQAASSGILQASGGDVRQSLI